VGGWDARDRPRVKGGAPLFLDIPTDIFWS